MRLSFGLLWMLGATLGNSVDCFAQVADPLNGYRMPSILRVAPGQVLTLFVPTFGSEISGGERAQGPDLPSVLAGIRVTLRQAVEPTTLSVPLLGVAPFSTCGAPGALTVVPCSGQSSLAITMQIPFELQPGTLHGSLFTGNEAVLTVYEGQRTAEFRVTPVADNAHLVRACDVHMAVLGGFRSDCLPAVTHADGESVTAENPARSGETLVAYLFGLGIPDSIVATGRLTPSPAPTVSTPLMVDVAIGSNLSPRRPLPSSGEGATVEFVGMTPSNIGLYQINFRLPTIPSGTPPCGTDSIDSNATVSFGLPGSFTGAPLCTTNP